MTAPAINTQTIEQLDWALTCQATRTRLRSEVGSAPRCGKPAEFVADLHTVHHWQQRFLCTACISFIAEVTLTCDTCGTVSEASQKIRNVVAL